ncbi:unnamed protein product [Sphagnum balticum]
MHWKEKDIYEYFKEYKHSQKKISVSKKIPARDFPFGAVDDVVQGPKELGLDIAEELGNNMVDFQGRKWAGSILMLDAKERLQRLSKHLFCKSKTCQLLHRLQKVGPWDYSVEKQQLEEVQICTWLLICS